MMTSRPCSSLLIYTLSSCRCSHYDYANFLFVLSLFNWLCALLLVMATKVREHDLYLRTPTKPRWHLKLSNIFLVKLHSLSYSSLTPCINSCTNTTSSMNPQDSPPAPQGTHSPSSSGSRASNFRYHASQYKWLICLLAGIVLVIMAIGLLFVAHQYYLEFGGQGWLKVRDENQEQKVVFADNLFLPLKKHERWNIDLGSRLPQNDVPYYQCGDQENSCETYNQPVCGRVWNILLAAMLTCESEYMLSSLGNLLRSILYSVRDLLLQRFRVTI